MDSTIPYRPSANRKTPKYVTELSEKAVYLSRLIQMRLRIWSAPFWPLKEQWYRESPVDPWKGSTATAEAMINHTLTIESENIESAYSLWKKMPTLSRDVQRIYYEFSWLRDLNTLAPNEMISAEAQAMVRQWFKNPDYHSEINSRISIRAERLANCLCYANLLQENADDAFSQQLRHYFYSEILMLADVMRRREEKTGLRVIKALIYGSLVMPSAEFLLKSVSKYLIAAMQSRFHEDGGHITHSPEYQRRDVTTLMEIRATMKKRQFPMPADFDADLQLRLDALASMTHRDGKTACFHNTIEHSITDITNLWQVWRKPRPLPQRVLPKTGYTHLTAKDSTLIFDQYNKPPSHPFHYPAPLAFEFSRDKARMVVNCAAYRGVEPAWQEATRHTAAHSTLSFDQIDVWDVTHSLTEESPLVKNKPEAALLDIAEEAITVEASHHGYLGLCGVEHRRKLVLSDDGLALNGLDTLSCIDEAQRDRRIDSIDFVTARFHLHPKVKIEKVAPHEVLLKLQNNEYWKFSSSDETLSLDVEDSVYLGETGFAKPTMQIAFKMAFTKKQIIEIPWKLEKIDYKAASVIIAENAADETMKPEVSDSSVIPEKPIKAEDIKEFEIIENPEDDESKTS